MLNHIVLIGRLCKDPELRWTQAGKAVTTMRLAVDRGTADKEADFIDCVVWEKQAESVANYLQKGRLVAVQGRFQNRNYEAQDGSKRTVAEVVCSQVKFLDRGDTAPQSMGSEYQPPSDDVPF